MTPGSHHEVIVVHVADGRLHDLTGCINRQRLRHTKEEIRMVVKYLPERVHDRLRLYPCSGHLIKKRLKSVEILPVDEHDLDIAVSQGLRQFNSTEPSAENHHTALVAFIYQ